jgi:hypothetical protein
VSQDLRDLAKAHEAVFVALDCVCVRITQRVAQGRILAEQTAVAIGNDAGNIRASEEGVASTQPCSVPLPKGDHRRLCEASHACLSMTRRVMG